MTSNDLNTGASVNIENNDANKPVLLCENLIKEYQVGPEPIRILDELNFTLLPGEWVAVVGASGSGKTTFLNMVAGLDQASEGCVKWGDEDISHLNETQLGLLRNRHLGFVYQFHHLLAEFSALENVAMPLWIQGMKKSQAKLNAQEMLERVGLGSRTSHKPAELSGGERQRVAIARALITQPSLVLMDEPTGNLDSHTADEIQKLIRELNQQLNTSFVVVTHDMSFASQAQKSYKLGEGKLLELEGHDNH